MNILFIHQNFPGQFKNIAPHLVKLGHHVDAVHMQSNLPQEWSGVRLHSYGASRSSSKEIHPWVLDFEAKTIRAEGCFYKLNQLAKSGYRPDLVVAHHGWGETIFIREVWPKVPLIIYCEFFYHTNGLDVNFDPEFKSTDPSDACRVAMKNLNNVWHFDIANAGLSPTLWQANTFPESFRNKISVIHDGIDTTTLRPDSSVNIAINNKISLSRKDEVITFVNRNLEPYRGYHIFLRSLPAVLKRRPNARAILIGGDGVSYGVRPAGAPNWKQYFIDETRSKFTDEQWSRIHFVGKVPYEQFVAILRVSSAHVYLTYPFVLSWSLLEALSLECPIIGSSTGPVEEVISDGFNGKLVNFFAVDSLSDAIVEFLENKDLGYHLGRNGRESVLEKYDIHNVLREQTRLFEGLAN